MGFDYSKLCLYDATNVLMEINDKLYGVQKIKSLITVINNETQIGFKIGCHKIFLYKNELKDVLFDSGSLSIADDRTTITVHKI